MAILRALEETDLEKMMVWENDTDAWLYSDTVAPLSRRQLQEYILTYDADPFRAGQLRLVLEERGEAVGLLDLYEISGRHAHSFVGVYIDPAKRRQGLARKGLELLSKYASAHLGLRTLAALILPTNESSVRLFETAGFQQCGILPGWRRISSGFSDVGVYTKVL